MDETGRREQENVGRTEQVESRATVAPFNYLLDAAKCSVQFEPCRDAKDAEDAENLAS